MNDVQQRAAAKLFSINWKDKGYEKGHCQPFWLSLLRDIYGVEQPEHYISFENQVHLDHTSFIDGSIPLTHVLIEQKGLGKEMNKPIRQSDGSLLSPFQQAKRYSMELPYSKRPRWIVTCNFVEFYVYDMERPTGEPEIIKLANLEKEYYRLQFLVDEGNSDIRRTMEVSLQAGELVGILYDALLKQYKNPEAEDTLKSLNTLCVRLVFCMYAEDSGIFGKHNMFHDYLHRHKGTDTRRALIELFKVLDTEPDNRDPYIDDDLAAFPYVNGGLFADETIAIPRLDETIVNLIVDKASAEFDWSTISPTIFGAVFESTLNPKTRRSGGMHYTSIENIHKVVDPLFLDSLRAEFKEIRDIAVIKTRDTRLRAFQTKMAGLKFLDPACGSGNFLTETYLSLRHLENDVISLLHKGQISFGNFDTFNPIQIGIGQFYGIEINDFAVTVAKTAMWIAESQMMKKTEDVVHMSLDFLPLKSYANIIEGNALRFDWESIVPKSELDYIMGNPPFVGLSLRDDEQQRDMKMVFTDDDRAGRLDYVSAWYKKAAEYIQETKIEVAFVSTNSIAQGEQVPILWGDLFKRQGVVINFAYRTFVWSSEAKEKAAVHCIIISFGLIPRNKKIIFESGMPYYVEKINGYLVNSENVYIQLRGKAQPNYPRLVQGNKPWDGGGLILSPTEKEEMITKYPHTASFIKKFIGSYEFINSKDRYCLWLKDVAPNEYRSVPEIMQRLKHVADVRRKTKTVSVQPLAETPMLFAQNRQPDSDYIMVPETSSSSRKYIPIGFMPKDVIASNSTLVATNATLYLFGIMTSNVHMAWTRTVCGRLKSDYRYSPSVYNNFPWPAPSDEQKARIEQTAQAVLNARAQYPGCSLADLYDENTMPPELRRAHQLNDKAVMQAYGFWGRYNTESACVAELMKMYQKMSGTEN